MSDPFVRRLVKEQALEQKVQDTQRRLNVVHRGRYIRSKKIEEMEKKRAEVDAAILKTAEESRKLAEETAKTQALILKLNTPARAKRVLGKTVKINLNEEGPVPVDVPLPPVTIAPVKRKLRVAKPAPAPAPAPAKAKSKAD